MSEGLTKIATGRSKYSTYFLLVFMCVAPLAVFTSYEWLDGIAWIMLIILGGFIFITGIVTRKEATDSNNWPKVEAKLLSTSLTYTSSGSGGTSKRYAPVIKCKFNVDGAEYKGVEYDFSASYTSKDKAEDKVNLIKQMKPLLIHYNPSAPEINVINPGIHTTHYIRIIIGLITVIIPILIWNGIIELK